MNNLGTKKIMQGAFVLSMASIVAKILSAVYRIPLQNLVGNTGFYVYQQIYPIYGIGMALALSGYPNFISKLVAEQDDEQQKIVVSWYALTILMVLGGFIFIALILSAPFMAREMGDRQLAPLIRVVAPMFLLMPILATGRGYYQGTYNMIPTAASQVVEQIVRVSIIVLVAVLAVKLNWSVYHMGTYAMLSSTIAVLFSSLFFSKFGWKIKRYKQTTFDWSRFKRLSKRFIVEGGLICLIAAMMVILQLVDSFTIKNNLVAQGLSQGAAKSLKGVYDRAQPLVQVGMVIATSFAASLLPSLTAAIQRKNRMLFDQSARALLRVSIMFSMTACVGMVALMPNLNRLLFGSAAGSSALSIYNFGIIFGAMIFGYNSVLQSMDKIKVTFWSIMIGVIFKVIFNGLAVRISGILGASLITVLSLGLMAMIMHMALPKALKSQVYQRHNFGSKLILGNLIMFIGVKSVAMMLTQILTTNRMASLVIVVIGMVLGGLIFGIWSFKQNILTKDEWHQIPYGAQILKMGQRFAK